jgi:transcriptional regulator GlxA family with amidase domain
MMQLGILLTRQHRLLSTAAILDVFENVNTLYKADGKSPFFNITLIYNGEWSDQFGAYPAYSPVPASQATQQHLILIPAFGTYDLQQAIKENTPFLPWLQAQYKNGAAIGSFCTGAFLLAASGLLNHKRATTHINSAAALARVFPEVIVQSESVVTQDERIYTSGGATSSFHLMLLLLQHYCSREIAIQIAKIFAIDMDRAQQSYFGSFKPTQDHSDQLVKTAQQLIETTYRDAGNITEIIQGLPASRRNIVRRFKHAVGITPIEYLQKTRVEAAKKQLEQTDHSILEVMLYSGYNDLKAFRQLFKKSVGMSPKAYREKFTAARAAVKV